MVETSVNVVGACVDVMVVVMAVVTTQLVSFGRVVRNYVGTMAWRSCRLDAGHSGLHTCKIDTLRMENLKRPQASILGRAAGLGMERPYLFGTR